MLFDEEIWVHLEQHTNEYAIKIESETRMKREEIETYLAIILAMGISPESELREYWSTTDPWTGNAGIAKTCSRRQFEAWNTISHFDLDWLISRCVKNAKKYWQPFEKMAVDEWLQAWKGTWKNRQYIKSKPHQNGLKWYLFADSSSYIWDCWLFKGNMKMSRFEVILTLITRYTTTNS